MDDFRQIRTGHARIILLDAASRILPSFTPGLSNSANEQLKQMGVEVRVETKVLSVTAEGVRLENEFISTRTVIWAAGNAASPLAGQLAAETDRQGRVLINEDLSVPGNPRDFCDRRHGQLFSSDRRDRSPVLRRSRCRWGHTRLKISWD